MIDICVHKNTAYLYLENPDNYIRYFKVTINGKLRDILTYQNNESGEALRKLHNAFAGYISFKYRTAASSFAYKKGKGIVDCVKCHLDGEFFLKTDIHAYFDSITYDNMLECLKKLRIEEDIREDVEFIARACFYCGRLPLGFTSSPVLSDLFLSFLDFKYQEIPDITYTRYADDFIISTNGQDAIKRLDSFKTLMSGDLEKLGLTLNSKKTYTRHLKSSGDALHVLGINIVRTDSGRNRITVSDSYVRETSKLLCDWLSGNQHKEVVFFFQVLFGRISFIKQCSNESFEKLKKMVRVKCGYDGPFTRKVLKGNKASIVL